MEIFYTRKAERQLAALPRFMQKRIVSKMRFFALQPDPLKFATRLTDYREGQFRFRVGAYRLTFDVSGTSMYILTVTHRRRSYE